MREPPKSHVPVEACACCRGASRRAFLRSSAQLALAGGLAAQVPLASARAQGAPARRTTLRFCAACSPRAGCLFAAAS